MGRTVPPSEPASVNYWFANLRYEGLSEPRGAIGPRYQPDQYMGAPISQNAPISPSTSRHGSCGCPTEERTGVLVIAVVSAVLAGCAASTGILPAGPNTYAVTAKFAPIRGGSLAAQPEALAEAQSYCQNQARVFLPVQMGETAPPRRVRLNWLSDRIQVPIAGRSGLAQVTHQRQLD